MTLVGLLIISCTHLQSFETIESQSVENSLRTSLHQIKISYFELTDASPYDAVKFIFDNTTLSLNNQITEFDSANRVNVSQKDASLFELLNDVCRQANLEWLLDGKLVIVRNIER